MKALALKTKTGNYASITVFQMIKMKLDPYLMQ